MVGGGGEGGLNMKILHLVVSLSEGLVISLHKIYMYSDYRSLLLSEVALNEKLLDIAEFFNMDGILGGRSESL